MDLPTSNKRIFTVHLQTQTRAFDTEGAGSSYATGFIVDKKRGIILTNRHVVTPGKALVCCQARCAGPAKACSCSGSRS